MATGKTTEVEELREIAAQAMHLIGDLRSSELVPKHSSFEDGDGDPESDLGDMPALADRISRAAFRFGFHEWTGAKVEDCALEGCRCVERGA